MSRISLQHPSTILLTSAAALVALLIAACTTLSPTRSQNLSPSYALADPRITSLGRIFASYVEQHAGESGFAIADSGREAFLARTAFAELAEKTIDAQYYLWEEDTTGSMLLSSLMQAADRGVRIRILLDDLHTAGKEYALAVIAAHPNIQVRLYNPFIGRSFRGWDVLFNFDRIKHRMHNKVFIVDNVVAIVGGRNVGDDYFSVGEQSNFRDLDLFAGGPIVHKVSESFDAFWNSAWAVPAHAFVDRQPTLEQFHKLEAKFAHIAGDVTHLPFPSELDAETLHAFVKGVPARLIWGKATVLADRPDKTTTDESDVLAGLWQKFGGTLTKELLLAAAYFVPGDKGGESLCALVARGVHVRVLTNSFASTDAAIVHAGYAKYRKELLRCGVELFELQPRPGFIKKEWRWLKGKSKAALHTKTAVFDRRAVFIGSFNLDPRSVSLNTEVAIVVESPALATEVARFIEAGMQPGNAYRVELDHHGDLFWTATERGKTVLFTAEPHVTFWRSLLINSLLLLPIEGQL